MWFYFFSTTSGTFLPNYKTRKQNENETKKCLDVYAYDCSNKPMRVDGIRIETKQKVNLVLNVSKVFASENK